MKTSFDLALALISTIGLIATIIALVLSLKQLRQAHCQTRELEGIGRSLSTRYVGKFPAFLPELVSLIESAERDLVIFCDFPAYARFSDPQRWLEYRQVLERKNRHNGFKLNFTCFDRQHRLIESRAQFGVTPETLEEWRRDTAHREMLQGLVNEYRVVATIEDVDPGTFLELLERADTQVLDQVLTPPAMVRELPVIPLFFWIADGKEAIFAFPSGGSEYGFRTIDSQLISAFLDLVRQYHRSGNESGPLASGRG